MPDYRGAPIKARAQAGIDSHASGNVTVSATPPAPPTLLPWRHTLITGAAALAATLSAYLAAGSAGAIGAVAGLIAGGFATMAFNDRLAVLVTAMVGGALALTLWTGGLWIVIVLCGAFVALVGYEVTTWGSRTFVMGLLAYLEGLVGIGFGGGWEMLPWLALGAVAGIGAAVYLKTTGVLPTAHMPPTGALALSLFLAMGLTVSFVLIIVLEEPRGYWIALLFVGRAIMPFETLRPSTLRFGQGAAIGVAFALLVEAMPLPGGLQLLIAFVVGMVGLRTLPHPQPIAAACISAAILLSVAPTLDEALFRIQAVAIVVGLIVFLTFGIERLWRALNAELPGTARG